jgi:3-deoxy-D-arabino-heptulosonate 7-phosphate (DAHP) synthase
VLQGAGVVHGLRAGREHLFEIRTASLTEARSYLDRVSEQWEDALARLKAFVEN